MFHNLMQKSTASKKQSRLNPPAEVHLQPLCGPAFVSTFVNGFGCSCCSFVDGGNHGRPWHLGVEHRWSETTAKVAVRQAQPTSATVSLHFLQISDSHITLSPLSGQEAAYGKRMHDAFYGSSPCLWNRSTVQTAPMFRELVDVAASAAVDAVLLSGDIVSFPQASAVDTVGGLLNETMRYKCGPQQGRRIPYVFTSGNHDWFLEGLPGSQPELQRTWRSSALRPLYVSSATWGDYPQFDYSSMEVEGVLLVVIDNSRYQVSHEQLAFFREQMLRWLPTVKDLTPSSLNVDLIVKVLASDGRLQCLSGAGLQLACVTVGDETGTVMLRLAAQQARLCEPGATLVLRSARAEMFAGQLRLELGRWSRVSALGDAALFTPKLQNDVLVLHVPLSLTDSLRPHRGFVLCGDPAWGEATDRSWRDERRDPWPKEGNDLATELFLEAVQAAAAPTGPLLAVLSGHTHGHDATAFGRTLRSEEPGHGSASDTVASAVQYICEPSMRGGHRFLNVVLTSAEESLGVTLSKRTAAHDLLLGLTWAAMTAYEPGEDPEIEHDLAWRCWGGIKNLEAAAAGIELTAVADGIDAVLHRTTEAVRAGFVLMAHGLRGLLKTSSSSCQGRRIFATCESCLEAVQCLLHFLALWADPPMLSYSPGLRLEVQNLSAEGTSQREGGARRELDVMADCTMLREFNQAIWAWQDGDWATFGYGIGKALLAANCSQSQT
eukprot:s3948_g2.t7